jgi:hypothetical protein
LSISLAFFGPTPGRVSAGANNGSSKAGRMRLYTGGGVGGERRRRRGKEDEDENLARWIVLVGGRPIRTVD